MDQSGHGGRGTFRSGVGSVGVRSREQLKRVLLDQDPPPDGCHEVGVLSRAVWFPKSHGVFSLDSGGHLQSPPRDVDLGYCILLRVLGIDCM